jgi:hypothetical protein
MSSKIFSQVAELNKNGDTTICFSVTQAKFLAKEHYRADAYFKSDSVCKAQSVEKDLIINMYKKMEIKLQTTISNQVTLIKLKQGEIDVLQETVNVRDKQLKRQKFYKYVSIISGAVLSGYLGFKYVTK